MINKSMQITVPVASCFSYSPIMFVIFDFIIILIGLWLIGKIDASNHPILYYIIFDICMLIIISVIGYIVYTAAIG